MIVTKSIIIEELVEQLPGAVRYLQERGITCIACGEPIWGTLEEAAIKKGFTDHEIDQIVADLNKINKLQPPNFI